MCRKFVTPIGSLFSVPLHKSKSNQALLHLIITLTTNSEALSIIVAAEVKSDGNGQEADDHLADPGNGDGDAEGSRVPDGGPLDQDEQDGTHLQVRRGHSHAQQPQEGATYPIRFHFCF